MPVYKSSTPFLSAHVSAVRATHVIVHSVSSGFPTKYVQLEQCVRDGSCISVRAVMSRDD